MTFANVGSIGVLPGKREEVLAILTRPNPELRDAGCLLYEVGASDDEPDKVFVTELWVSRNAHRASLMLDSVRKAIAEAMPFLSGEMSGSRFEITGSPLTA